MNFLFFLFSGNLGFVTPPILQPTGLFLTGDPDIVSISDSSKRIAEYRIPRDTVGVQVKVQLAYNSPLNIYMNRDESSFNKVITPPMNELTEENVGLVSLADEKFIMIVHDNLLKENTFSKDWSINDTK